MNHSWRTEKILRVLLPALLIISLHRIAAAQELQASVSVDRSRINSTSLNFLNDFSREVENYLNEYRWTDNEFHTQERIRLDLQITLLSVDDDYNFAAQLVIRSYRPIYNSLQETALFFFNDENWQFNYTPNRGFIHDELQFDALTSVLDFYAYVVIGYDFDSFELLGGSSAFNEAQNIVSLAQTVSTTGWSSSDGRRNRARLISDLQNPGYADFRRALYYYHRQGLDTFLEEPGEGRSHILQALQLFRDTKRRTSGNLLFDTFFNAKYRELASLFEHAEPPTRLKAYNLLTDIDQSHLSEYQQLQ